MVTAAPTTDHGQQADTPAQVPAAGWKEIALRTWKESSKDNVGIVAAGVAFYGFLALVPLLGAIVLTYGLFASPETVVRHAQSLTAMLPVDAAKLIGEQLMNVTQTSGGKKGLGLLLALAVALWGAKNAAGSVITALNIAYEEEEKRGFIKATLLALAITVAAVVLAILAGGATAVLSALHHLLPNTGPVGLFIWKLLTYALLAAAAAAAAATLYRYGPSRDKAKWTWLTPGSIFFAVTWLLLTLGFGYYVSNFGNYGATYGSLSAVVVLLTWLYLSSYVLLFGAEFNSEIEHQTLKDTTSGPNKPLGARGAWSADHVAAGSEDSHDKPPQPGATPEENAGAAGGSASVQAVAPATHLRGEGEEKENEHPYLTSRVTSRAGRLAGSAKIGMLGSALATLGLGFLRKRGKEKTGAALLATAAGLALLRRKD
ncbi:YihY/virulence factor BrkB family protein [Sphingomonas sp. GCM10030256]|uniref:YihY/virulence factor BrkB family protein n=1 Tax=Sphingomonas sp. GCM10030256 TaxID=3273427 RepID=UPI00361522DD